MIFKYKDHIYPEYLKHGGASQYIAPIAKKLCVGCGLDIGCGEWPLEGAQGIDIKNGQDAMSLPDFNGFDYIFSSHCLEHLSNPVAALEHWKSKLRQGGVLFLY